MVTWAQKEKLDDEEEAQVEDGDVDMETDSGESTEADANVSFEVSHHSFQIINNWEGVKSFSPETKGKICISRVIHDQRSK